MPPDLTGTMLLGRYRLEARLGPTPLGWYYRAWDAKNNKHIGIIELDEALGADSDLLKRINTSTASRTKLTHPNLLPYLGPEQTSTQTYLLEAYSDGPSLRDILHAAEGRPLSQTEAFSLLRPLAAALDHLHATGLAHTALCPELIHFDASGTLRLGGLGACAEIGASSRLPATPAYPPRYASPEQYTGAPTLPASDHYALGVILFEMLTGRGLSLENDPEALRRAHTYLLPPAPRTLNGQIPDFAARLMLKALSKRPEERPLNASEFYLSMCMAARINASDLPEKPSAQTAPITHALLRSWPYLPPDEVISPTIPLRPLVENLSAATGSAPPPAKPGLKNLLRPALALIFIGLFIYFLSQIRPAQVESAAPAEALPQAAPTLPSPTPAPRPTHPHGGRIIFTCTRGDFNQLCMVNADGTEVRRVTRQPAHDYYPVFAPQGGMFVFASNRNGAFDIYLFIINGNRLFQLTNYIGNVISPDFSPDGEKIVFANRAADGPTSIWVVDKAGVNPKLLYAGPNTIVATAWSPNGEAIAFAMAVDQPDAYEIFVMNPDASNIRRISQGLSGIGGSLDWSPDGKHLLIYAGPAGDKDLYLLDVANGQFSQLTDGGNNAAASFSPDGQWIAFNSLRNNGQADIFVMRRDGSDLRQITSDPEPDWQPRWEP